MECREYGKVAVLEYERGEICCFADEVAAVGDALLIWSVFGF